MKDIPGLKECFNKSRVVFLTTFSPSGEERSRKMTNLNEELSTTIWFPTYVNTRKVKDIQSNPKTLVTFPAEKVGEFYEIEGNARIETGDEVEKKWFWWYLYWRPSQRNRFWFPAGKQYTDRAIIYINPTSAKLIKKK